MEQLILKLTQAINEFNKYIKDEYSSINKNFSGISNSIGDYSIFTLVAPKLNNYKIIKSFPRANFVQVSIDNPNDNIYLSFNALSKEKLAFRDGSKYEGIFSELFLSYDFSSYLQLPKVTIFIGYNSKYNPITSVKIADIDSANPLPVQIEGGSIEEVAKDYSISSDNGNVNNNIVTINLPEVSGKSYTSLIITNLDNTNELYFGNISDISDIAKCIPINAGEKFSVEFKPRCKSFSFTLASSNSVNYQYSFLQA